MEKAVLISVIIFIFLYSCNKNVDVKRNHYEESKVEWNIDIPKNVIDSISHIKKQSNKKVLVGFLSENKSYISINLLEVRRPFQLFERFKIIENEKDTIIIVPMSNYNEGLSYKEINKLERKYKKEIEDSLIEFNSIKLNEDILEGIHFIYCKNNLNNIKVFKGSYISLSKELDSIISSMCFQKK